MSLFGLPDLGSVLGGGGGGGGGFPGLPNITGLPSFPGFPGFPGVGSPRPPSYGDGSLSGPYQTSPDPYADSGASGGPMNLQALLDMMQRNQQGQGGGQSYIGGQGLI